MQRMQMQQRRKSINSKLDEILKRLTALMDIVEDEIYPDENKLKKSYLTKEARLDRAIKSGKTKLRKFRSFAELDKTIG